MRKPIRKHYTRRSPGHPGRGGRGSCGGTRKRDGSGKRQGNYIKRKK